MEESVKRNSEDFRKMRVKSLVQEIRIIALVDVDKDGDVIENELVIDSLRRPLPIPYNEEQ